MTYNSLTKQKEPLVLAQERIASWYSCGPTVYDHAHLGHACSYVRFDILQRILSKLFGINVIHVMVITDIDDKIIQRSLEENISPTVLARMHEEEFKKDMQALRVLPPAVYMRVTDNIPQIVAFIERIIRNGHAYVTNQGNVYFNTQSIGSRYGKLVNLGGVVGEQGVQDKRDPRDFALWKASKPHEPHWDSPWGQGRPGWHIECSTIASSVFGSQLDIHSGGIDLAFPHHENEIAQSEAYHQCEQWGNYFLHSAIDYSDASMNEARSTLSTISAFCHNAQAYMQGHLQCQPIDEGILWERLCATQTSVRKVLSDDFDTPKAVDAIMSLIHHGNCQLQPVTKVHGPRSPVVFGAMLSYVREIMGVFGVDLLDTKSQNYLLDRTMAHE
ncbi:putative cysteine--tRNA ligase, mitochondrial [Anabarilius grahami]|uniref:cysteine--tRNA ligase n=1 Tax=Anabarilius grahami TaxID=495550 RepID=A0A3N0XIS3_ANAGA|nr:putative cysteine--tRNA ligase, mitochondrial [Anabarilius grahami]